MTFVRKIRIFNVDEIDTRDLKYDAHKYQEK